MVRDVQMKADEDHRFYLEVKTVGLWDWFPFFHHEVPFQSFVFERLDQEGDQEPDQELVQEPDQEPVQEHAALVWEQTVPY